MKKKINHLFATFLLTLLALDALCQITSYPAGGYTSVFELQQKKPFVRCLHRLNLRPNEEIIKRGGNDFQAEVQDPVTFKWKKEKKTYAISDGEKLYINGEALKLPPGYMDVMEEGPFLLFQSCTPKISNYQVIVGGSGSMVAISPDNGRMLRKKIYYCMDITNGEVKILDKVYLREKLEKYADLYDQFQQEPESTQMETLLRYFRLLNSKQ